MKNFENFRDTITKSIEKAKEDKNALEIHKLLVSFYPASNRLYPKEVAAATKPISSLLNIVTKVNVQKIKTYQSFEILPEKQQISFETNDGRKDVYPFYDLVSFLKKALEIEQSNADFYLLLSYLMEPMTFQSVQIYCSLELNKGE